MAADETREIFCGACHVPAEAGVDAQGHGRVQCRACGRNDSLEDAARDALTHQARKMIDDTLGNFGAGNDFIKVTRSSGPKSSPRWYFPPL